MFIGVTRMGTAVPLELFTQAAGGWTLAGFHSMIVTNEVHTEVGAGQLKERMGYQIFLLCSLRGTAL